MPIAPDLVAAIAPTGRLRAAINLGNPILAGTDPASGQAVGISVDLARAFAALLGVEVELVVFKVAKASVDAVAGERALHVATRKALALLALLALDGASSRDRLSSCLWPELDPPAARLP